MEPKHPYQHQPEKAFWKKTVSYQYPLDITQWYSRKFTISNLAIATAGSCFAQHIGKQLKAHGFNFVDVEPPPRFMPIESHLDYGYSMYSARYGNVYSSRQLLQLVQRAFGRFTPKETYWYKDDGYVDPFRPTIEPDPFISLTELDCHRNHHLQCVRKLLKEAQVFVFTFGLTEAWASVEDGAVFPMAPGVTGGAFDPRKYRLLNLSCADVISDMEKVIRMVRSVNKRMRFVLTVSPVPLIATATNQQVVVATMHSKSVLRAAAGFLASKYRFVDYFPSYEIISAPVMRGQFFNPDMRTVSNHGVEYVMKQFFIEHQPPKLQAANTIGLAGQEEDDEVLCDEELLAAFGD